ncbi:MAG: hypothetical protein ACKOI2_10640 [Actinomycetota bacterium]
MTVQLTRAEIEILCRITTREWARWDGLSAGPFRDAKERDRVLTYRHLSGQLAEKLTRKKKEFA